MSDNNEGPHITQYPEIFLNSFKKAAWAPLAVFIFYAVAAKAFNAYILFPWLDMPTHFLGGVAITYFFLTLIFYYQKISGPVPQIFQYISAVGLTAVTAIVWEFLEYGSDCLLETKMNLGTADTLKDLFFGLLGALMILRIRRSLN